MPFFGKDKYLGGFNGGGGQGGQPPQFLGGLLGGGQMSPEAQFLGGLLGIRRPRPSINQQQPVAPGGDVSNPNPDYNPMPDDQKNKQGLFSMLGNALIPNTMNANGKGGGVS